MSSLETPQTAPPVEIESVMEPEPQDNDSTTPGTEKAKKRKLFGFGKKKESATSNPDPSTSTSQTASQPLSPNRYPYSSSNQAHSPASSQIFERDVLESTNLPPSSPAVPQHIIAEDRIPPVLEASSLAITDEKLDPDVVEIVTHASHVPAAVSVSASTGGDGIASPVPEEPVRRLDDESVPGYGTLDSNDVRRLSFISFADVVQSEHEKAGLSSVSPSHRSASPARSPSSHGLSTPPSTGLQVSREADHLSEASLKSPSGSSELAVETMRQALRKTASGDLAGDKSLPLSASSQDGPARPWA